MRTAVIDLGTNTFNLLIAEIHDTKFEVVHSEKEGVALGMGGINKNIIAPEAWLRAINTLIHFKEVCNSFGAKQIRAIGTSAIRSAENSADFVQEVAAKTGITIEIISGLQEAKMIFDGVLWSYDFSPPAVIMDIGGGSTEFVWADKDGITEALSLDIGVSRMYQSLQLNDPLTSEDVAKIEHWLEDTSKGLLNGKTANLLIGASGTFETFYELHHQKHFPNTIEAIPIAKNELDIIIYEIMLSTLADREKNDFIIPIRKKMSPIAATKTRWVMNKLGVKEVLISPCSLKEGALKVR